MQVALLHHVITWCPTFSLWGLAAELLLPRHFKLFCCFRSWGVNKSCSWVLMIRLIISSSCEHSCLVVLLWRMSGAVPLCWYIIPSQRSALPCTVYHCCVLHGGTCPMHATLLCATSAASPFLLVDFPKQLYQARAPGCLHQSVRMRLVGQLSLQVQTQSITTDSPPCNLAAAHHSGCHHIAPPSTAILSVILLCNAANWSLDYCYSF